MNEEIARDVLHEFIQPDNGLFNLGHYLAWTPGDDEIVLDDGFTVDELEAIVWWIRNHSGPSCTESGLADGKRAISRLWNECESYKSVKEIA